MRLCRFGVAIFLALTFSSSAIGQEPDPLPAESISNWSAPPYWRLAKADVEQIPSEGAVGTLGLEAVDGGAPSDYGFTGVSPCRLVDTRGNGFTGAFGPPALAQGVPRDFNVINRCDISSAARAVSLNITVTNTQGPGFILIYPQGASQPTVSTLNYVAGQTIANAAVVPLGASGAFTVIAGVSGTDLIIDTNGYYAPLTVVTRVNGMSGAVSLVAGSNISITPGAQTLTIAGTAPAAWSLTGNAGTTAGTNFLGTTDNQALELKVNGQRAFRLVPNGQSPDVIGGHSANTVTAGVYGATIAGGGGATAPNLVTDTFGTVGGGNNNRAGDGAGAINDHPLNTVGGGGNNVASGNGATVAGGITNFSTGSRTTVGGGATNTAGGGTAATVAGGESNQATGAWSAVPGGVNNIAAGSYSFAAGRHALANHDGSFVWADGSTANSVGSAGVNQFIVRAGGIWFGTTSAPSIPGTDFLNTSTGAHLTTSGIWTNNSDRALKEDFEAVDGSKLLLDLAALPMSTWSYKADKGAIRHIGPMAQDFAAAFGVGNDDRSIGTLDADGVALAAIQALYQVVKEKDAKIEALESRLVELESMVH